MNDLDTNDFTIVARIQHRFYATGWRWWETTFAERGEVVIRFCPTTTPSAFTIGSVDEVGHFHPQIERRYGWGRFHRTDAWQRAERFLLDEQCNSENELQRLREYKRQFGMPCK